MLTSLCGILLILLPYATFTPDTCNNNNNNNHRIYIAPYASYRGAGYKLYPQVVVYIVYRRQSCRHGNMYPLISASRTCLELVSSIVSVDMQTDTCCSSGILVSGYMYTVGQKPDYLGISNWLLGRRRKRITGAGKDGSCSSTV